jgi:hypothetical protein
VRPHRILIVSLLLIAGCSAPPGPVAGPPYDTERARATLGAALDAWKKGEARSLARRKPPIRFEDDDLATGFRLLDYEIDSPDAPRGPHEDVPVMLSLKDPRRKVVQREARYQVAIEPALAVLRSDR